MPNPMQEYGSAEELSDAVGFTVKEIGELPFTVKETQYFTYDDTLAEIRYTGMIRKCISENHRGMMKITAAYTTHTAGDYDQHGRGRSHLQGRQRCV